MLQRKSQHKNGLRKTEYEKEQLKKKNWTKQKQSKNEMRTTENNWKLEFTSIYLKGGK